MTSNTLIAPCKGIHIVESGILGFGIRNPTSDWVPLTKTGIAYLESRIRNPWRRIRNPSLSWIPLLVAIAKSLSPRRTDVYCEETTCTKLCKRPVSVILHKRLRLTGAPNDVLLLHTLKTLCKLSRVLLDIEKCILSGAIEFVSVQKFVSVRSS